MGSFEMKGLSLAAATTSSTILANPESTHDLVIRKSREALQNLTKEGWLDQTVQEIYKSAAKDYRPGMDNNIDWKAKFKAMEFASMVAKGEVERTRQRLLEKLMDALI